MCIEPVSRLLRQRADDAPAAAQYRFNLLFRTQTQEPAMTDLDLAAIDAERERIRTRYLRSAPERPGPSARGVHHVALLCADVERTIRFYQEVLEFPLTEIFENRDYQGSNHFFFDVGNGNLLAFFDLPGLDLGAYAEVLGGLHHLAISVEPGRWLRLKANLDRVGVQYQMESDTSVYFRDPDGARLELIADPLGQMYGTTVL
jgi:catechol 2,3-dioxygenase-like lactoylglutathione lyase family enzyme